MGLFGSILKIAAPIIGTAIAPGIGTALGGVVGNAVAGGGGGGESGGGGNDTLQTILKAAGVGVPALFGLLGGNSASKKQNANLALMQQIAAEQLRRQQSMDQASAPIRQAAQSLLLSKLQKRGLAFGAPAAGAPGSAPTMGSALASAVGKLPQPAKAPSPGGLVGGGANSLIQQALARLNRAPSGAVDSANRSLSPSQFQYAMSHRSG